MADEDSEDQQVEEKISKPSILDGKKKLILIIVAALLVVSSSIGGTLYLLGFFDSGEMTEEGDEQQASAAAAEIEKPKAAMYFPIKPAFVINFPSRGRQRFLQVDMTVMTRDMDVLNAMQTHSPLIKNQLVMLLSGESYDELQTEEGKELLRQKSLEALQAIMQQEVGKDGIEQVLFTGFVMQ